MRRATLRLAGRQEEHDPDEGKSGASNLTPPDVLASQPDAQEEGNDKAERYERLHYRERRPIQGYRLKNPTEDLE